MSCGSVGRRGDEISWRKECRENIRVAVMCDDAGQQRLPTAAEERLAPAASAARAEVAQESRDEEMNEACVTNNAENVKPRSEVSREDSIEWRKSPRLTNHGMIRRK